MHTETSQPALCPTAHGDSAITDQPWHAAGQATRRAELLALVRQRLRPLLDATGRSTCLVRWSQPREAMRGAIPFLRGDAEERALGNEILRYTRDELDVKPGEPRVFESCILASLLSHSRDALAADTRDFVESFLQESLPLGLTRDFQFHGYNDNMPVMWTWALCFGGEYFDVPRWREVARANLCQLRDMLMRRGTVSEYGAGYCTHRLTGIAEIAEHSADAEMRTMARDCEARIWAELAGHWHPALAQVSGGSMRGDMRAAGLFSWENYAVMRQVFGDGILVPGLDWRDALDGEPEHIRDMRLDPAQYKFAGEYGYLSEVAMASYQVPDAVAALFLHKPVGFTFACNAENGHTNEGLYCKQVPVLDPISGTKVKAVLSDELVEIPHFPTHGAQTHGLYTWHGRHVALGTSTTNQFSSSYVLRCHYRRSTEPVGLAALGSIRVRYNLNGKRAGSGGINTYWKSPELSERKDNRVSVYDDSGRHHCLQHGHSALCLQVPEPREAWQVGSMATELLFRRDGGIGRFYVGDDDREVPCDTLPASFAEAQLVTVDEGAVYLGIVPLICRHGERQAAMRLREEGEFRILSLVNVEREPAPMVDRDMRKLGNGFLLVARDAADFADFAAFQAHMRGVQVLDQLYAGTRRVHVRHGDLRLSLIICPYTNTVMQRTVNGQDATPPKLHFSNGLEASLPLMRTAERLSADAEWAWLETQFSRDHEPYNPNE